MATSEPSGYPRLDLGRECEKIVLSWGDQVSFLEHATPEALRGRLRDEEPHVLHFMGHGTFHDSTSKGQLVLETPAGEPHLVTGEQMAVTLQDIRSLRLVLLNALRENAWNKSRVTKALRIPRQSLYNKISKYDLQRGWIADA